MDFLKIEEGFTIKDIQKVLEENIRIAAIKKKEIKEYQEEIEKEERVEQKEKKEIKEIETVKEENSEFEDEIDYYLGDYKSLTDISKESLKEILPQKSHYEYEKILYRLMLESIKEIKEIEEFIEEETDKDSLLEMRHLIEVEKEKIRFLKELLKEEEIEEEIEKKNKIFLAPTPSGRIRIQEDMKTLPQETYPGFIELIESIKNGTFKGVKRLINDLNLDLAISEVRGDGIRILFSRMDKNSYIIITAFQKKTMSSKGYHEMVKSRIQSYKQILESFKYLLEEESYQIEQEKEVEELFQTLKKEEKREEKVK